MTLDMPIWILMAFAVVWALGVFVTLALCWLTTPPPDPLGHDEYIWPAARRRER